MKPSFHVINIKIMRVKIAKLDLLAFDDVTSSRSIFCCKTGIFDTDNVAWLLENSAAARHERFEENFLFFIFKKFKLAKNLKKSLR